jgi:hypothetical protein
MAPDERLRELCAQLLRAENPDVIESVAAQLHGAIDHYVQLSTASQPFPTHLASAGQTGWGHQPCSETTLSIAALNFVMIALQRNGRTFPTRKGVIPAHVIFIHGFWMTGATHMPAKNIGCL